MNDYRQPRGRRVRNALMARVGSALLWFMGRVA